MRVQTVRDRTILIIIIALIVMTACAIAILLMFMFFGNLFPSQQKTATPQTPDLVWQKIESNQKMVVGVSADYPPFDSIGPDFTLQGYDIALIQDIGNRLSVPLEIRNMAFDGLENALILGQVDVAVAAISVTPERDRVIDFSNVYYVGEDAVLARKGSAIKIVTVQDMAKYRLGVQKGSAYADWVQDTLIAPGYMKPQLLFAYQTFDEALQALTNPDPEIDLFMLDLQPAQDAAQSQPVELVAHDLNPQDYAIAIPQGSYTLEAHLNEALQAMQKDGTLAKLAQQYLNVQNPPPIPTPAPTQPPATPSVCLDGMRFVQDLSFPDYNMTRPPQTQPGATIQKGWRVMNTGTCTWDNTYVLAYTGSAPSNAPIGGNPVAIQGQVAPGQTYDIYVTLTAPAQPGRYQSFWSLRTPKSTFFGDRIWAGFEVVGQATPTAGPQAPTIYSFTANSNQIVQGQCIILNWQFSGQQIAFSRIFRNGALLQFDLPYTGSTTDCPPTTGQVQYQLVVDSTSSGSANASQYVNVLPPLLPTVTPAPTPEQPPVIFFFQVDTQDITVGECVNLSWSYGGSGALSAQLYRDGDVIGTDLSTSGTQQDCPPQPGQIEYQLVVTSFAGGAAQESQFVRVRGVEPVKPVITSFTADPLEIDLGQCTTLSWIIQAQGNNSTTLFRNGQPLASELSYTGSYQDCIDDEAMVGQVTYTIQISGDNGSDSQDVTVTVNPLLRSMLMEYRRIIDRII